MTTNPTRNLSTYALSHRADCADPDTRDSYGVTPPEATYRSGSPGAVFLRNCADAYDEVRTYGTFTGNPDLYDTVHEIADSAVPVYTHEIWAVFTDLAAYQEDLTDYGDTPADMTEAAQLALYMIAQRLLTVLQAEAEAEAEDSDQ